MSRATLDYVESPVTVTADDAQTRRLRRTLLATSLGFAIVQLDVSVVNVAVRQIGRSLGGGVSGLQWVVDAYTITFAAFILIAGAIADRLGARRLFVAGFVVFTGASVICGAAPTIAALVAARLVQGLAAAVLVPCSLVLIAHSFPEGRERAKAVAWWAAGASTAFTAGPIIGGLLTSAISWRANFFINVPIGALGIWLTLDAASETPRSEHKIDLPGQVLAVLALASLTASTIEGGRVGWTSGYVLAGFAAAILAGIAFVWQEKSSYSPLLPLSLFRSRTFSATAAIGLSINAAYYGLIFVLSLFLQIGDGYSPIETGLAFVPSIGTIIAANLLAPRLADRFAARRVILASALAGSVGAAALALVGTGSPYEALVAQLVVLGASIGLIVPLMTSELLSSVDSSRSGVASGTLNMSRQTGSALGVALLGSVIGARRHFAHGLHLSGLMAAVILLACAALAALMHNRGRLSDESSAP